LLNFIPVTVPPVSVALKVRVTEAEVVEAAPELITTVPVGGVVSVTGTVILCSVDFADSFPEVSKADTAI
jgi:hypothetical protein